MWEEIVLRFFLGGIIVSVFALLSEALKPQSFAGLFSAAPSIALATLSLALLTHGRDYVAVEARSMIEGAIALAVYSYMVSYVVVRYKFHSLLIASLSIAVWFCVAFGLWAISLN